ncbi:formylglycine-generating enzyme family protein [Halomonas sp.]|uniref:formylglycine-generating enzyme family protein n=1 Tax=Halomonas sp. TaxID=1486246 RepID=UPI00257CBA21|nr:formylglycine-generating enzyme family protein [Halomonas sp.]MCJ8287584.1 formylglycine-generating enzyme family protein [Halomonas sp.]NQY72305.1 formylglycine-generating enzyme family protein [Halomonas sp.]
MTSIHDTSRRSCCSPSADAASRSPAIEIPWSDTPRADEGAVEIPGGKAYLGTATPVILDDGEGPLRRKRVAAFRIGATAVTNAQFAAFVEDTGFVTEAERLGWSFVFHRQVAGNVRDTLGVASLEWWRRVDGAYWRDVDGAGKDAATCLADHPVVHVSWHDAKAYASWAGGRLPTEVEWEHAARGGQGDVPFPWGDRQPDDTSYFPCNIWQGRFPHENLGRDGYLFTAPAKAFAPNGYGLFNMVGNVWEWTAEPFVVRSLRRSAQAFGKSRRGCRLLKGGSHLCHVSYCFRYRIAARSSNTPDSTTTHQGFRVVWDIQRTAK